MVVTAILSLVIIWCVYRIRRYPLAKGLRRLAVVYVPSVLASRPIIRLANRMLLAMPRPEATRLVDEEEGVIDLGDHSLEYVIYRPKNASGPLPAMLYMHGGGFFLEAAPYLYGKAMGYSSGAGCIVMVPRYRTSDVHPWPAGEDDCMAALRHLCSLDGVDATRIALGGDSAGACIAATLARRCRKEGIGVCFQLLVYPVLDNGLTSASSLRYREGSTYPLWLKTTSPAFPLPISRRHGTTVYMTMLSPTPTGYARPAWRSSFMMSRAPVMDTTPWSRAMSPEGCLL